MNWNMYYGAVTYLINYFFSRNCKKRLTVKDNTSKTKVPISWKCDNELVKRSYKSIYLLQSELNKKQKCNITYL